MSLHQLEPTSGDGRKPVTHVGQFGQRGKRAIGRSMAARDGVAGTGR